MPRVMGLLRRVAPDGARLGDVQLVCSGGEAPSGAHATRAASAALAVHLALAASATLAARAASASCAKLAA